MHGLLSTKACDFVLGERNFATRTLMSNVRYLRATVGDTTDSIKSNGTNLAQSYEGQLMLCASPFCMRSVTYLRKRVCEVEEK